MLKLCLLISALMSLQMVAGKATDFDFLQKKDGYFSCMGQTKSCSSHGECVPGMAGRVDENGPRDWICNCTVPGWTGSDCRRPIITQSARTISGNLDTPDGRDIDAQCVDKDFRCPCFAKAGECSRTSFMVDQCQSSCGECGDENPYICDDLTSDCIQWANDGHCTEDEDYMSVYCPLSCGICTQGCGDTDNRCHIWAVNGECNTHEDWMLTNCAMSCGSCNVRKGLDIFDNLSKKDSINRCMGMTGNCTNHGFCIPDGSDRGDYICNCNVGYSGSICQYGLETSDENDDSGESQTAQGNFQPDESEEEQDGSEGGQPAYQVGGPGIEVGQAPTEVDKWCRNVFIGQD